MDGLREDAAILFELTPHVEKRMEDRDFTEVELRAMLESPDGIRPDVVPGRWVAETQHRLRRWEVILEPDETEQRIVVVTAYPVEEP